MAIRVIAVGRKHEAWVESGINRYSKRLRKPFDVRWELLAHSAREATVARQEESRAILKRLDPSDFVVLLDERGELLDSPALSSELVRQLEQSKGVTIVVGGAYGVDKTIHERADLVLSLSPLVFPHQLVRLILAEQLYRAQEIAAGNPYHHD